MIARYPGYLGGKAISSRDALARARFQFTNGVSWIGPVGPTRGKAKVYIDGKYAKTVDTYSSVFRPTRVLFKATFGSVRSRRLTIAVMGTKGHAMVAIDAIVVRSGQNQTPAPSAAAAPAPQTDPAPAPTADPTPAPSAAAAPAPQTDSTPGADSGPDACAERRGRARASDRPDPRADSGPDACAERRGRARATDPTRSPRR